MNKIKMKMIFKMHDIFARIYPYNYIIYIHDDDPVRNSNIYKLLNIVN